LPSRHAAADLAEFASGEAAQVVARDLRDGRLVFLPRGSADEVRPVAVEHYACPVPGCDAPQPISTRGGSRRDHFWHRRPHAHPGGLESLHHFQAKHLVAEWAREAARSSGVAVVVNEEQWSPDVRRRPDVLATWPNGRRVAFEVEYKSFPVAAWRAKDDAYRAAGITPVWLFGHAPERYLKPERRQGRERPEGEPGLFRLTALTASAAQRGAPVLFINPVLAKVGTLWDAGERLEDVRAEGPYWAVQRSRRVGVPIAIRPDPTASFDLALDALADCLLDPQLGLVTPTTRAIATEAERVHAAAIEDRAAFSSEARAARTGADRPAPGRQSRAPEPVRAVANESRCRVCLLPLDPSLAELGRHVLC
jgi:hypothetical protein